MVLQRFSVAALLPTNCYIVRARLRFLPVRLRRTSEQSCLDLQRKRVFMTVKSQMYLKYRHKKINKYKQKAKFKRPERWMDVGERERGMLSK